MKWGNKVGRGARAKQVEGDKKKMKKATGGDRGERRGNEEVSSFTERKKNRQHICLERDAQHLNSRLEDKALFLTNLHSAGQIVQLRARVQSGPVCTFL